MVKVDIFFSLNMMDNVDVSVGHLYIGEHCVNRCVCLLFGIVLTYRIVELLTLRVLFN